MPRFFFDTTETHKGRTIRDEDGSVFPDVMTAKREAQAFLGGLAKDELPDGDFVEFVIHVRGAESEKPLVTLTMTVRAEHHGAL